MRIPNSRRTSVKRPPPAATAALSAPDGAQATTPPPLRMRVRLSRTFQSLRGLHLVDLAGSLAGDTGAKGPAGSVVTETHTP